MCKFRVYEKRLVQGEEAKGDVAGVPGCLMGVMEEKEPDSRRGVGWKFQPHREKK